MILGGQDRQRWTGEIQFEYEDEGDGTIPTRSAMLEGAEMHPVRQAHGALYSDKDAKMRLRYELVERVGGLRSPLALVDFDSTRW